MNTTSISPYYIIRFVEKQDTRFSPVFSVPASWIRWQRERIDTVLVAYPEEPWDVTMERVKRYENPQRNWNSFLAQIEGSSYNYSAMIRSINERECVGQHSTPRVATPQPGPSHCSVPPNSGEPVEIDSPELKKWVSGLPSVFNQNPFQVGTIEDFLVLKFVILKTQQEIDIEKNRANRTSEISADNSGQSSREHSLRFTELMPESGVYIETFKLKNCLTASKNCFQLAWQLMTHIFSETGLKPADSLKERAITAIMDFVSKHETKENWPSSQIIIESALRFQLQLLKNSNNDKLF